MQWPLQMVVSTGWHLGQPSFSRDTVWLMSWQGGSWKAAADGKFCSLVQICHILSLFVFALKRRYIRSNIKSVMHNVHWYMSRLTKNTSFFVIKYHIHFYVTIHSYVLCVNVLTIQTHVCISYLEKMHSHFPYFHILCQS